MRQKRILAGLLFPMLLAFCLGTSAREKKGSLPRLPGYSLLVVNFPEGLAVTTGDQTLTIQGGGEWYVTPSMSADGKTIASARSVAGDPPAARPWLIVGISADGRWTDYKDLEVYNGTISISPDGSKIACISRAAAFTTSVIRILDIKAGLIITGPDSTRDSGAVISWSPDNRHLVFDREIGIYVMDTDSGKVSRVADGWWPSWSPSGEWIAYFDQNRLRLMHPDGSDSRILTKLRWFDTGFGEAPVWSPDSTTILIQIPQQESILPRMDIYSVNVASHRRTKRFSMSPPIYAWAAAN